jgi:hypothetical protein
MGSPVSKGGLHRRHTLHAQLDKIKKRFGLKRVVLVGDRSMITQARVDAELRPAGLDWIIALRAPDIKALAEGGALQTSLFDERDIASITSPVLPGERLIVCRNGDLARLALISARNCFKRPNAISSTSPKPCELFTDD